MLFLSLLEKLQFSPLFQINFSLILSNAVSFQKSIVYVIAWELQLHQQLQHHSFILYVKAVVFFRTLVAQFQAHFKYCIFVIFNHILSTVVRALLMPVEFHPKLQYQSLTRNVKLAASQPYINYCRQFISSAVSARFYDAEFQVYFKRSPLAKNL